MGSRVPSVSPSPWAPARGASAGAKQEAGTGSSWPYKAILALSMQLPAAPHPKAGSGAGSQRLACLLPVNLFPAEGPPEGRAGLGWPRPGPACEGTTACTGRDGRGVPHAQLGWLRSLGGCSGACSPSPTLLEEKKDRRCRRTEDAEEGQKMQRTSAPCWGQKQGPRFSWAKPKEPASPGAGTPPAKAAISQPCKLQALFPSCSPYGTDTWQGLTAFCVQNVLLPSEQEGGDDSHPTPSARSCQHEIFPAPQAPAQRGRKSLWGCHGKNPTAKTQRGLAVRPCLQ